MSDNKRVSAPIRMSPDLLEKVRIASDRTGIAQADILRICLAIGLEDLRRIDYDIATAILESSRREQNSRLQIAEEFKLSSVADSKDTVSLPKIQPAKYPKGKIRGPKIHKLDREEEA